MVDDPLKGRVLRLGTRGSPLALAQANEVCHRLVAAWPVLGMAGRLVIVPIMTTGDRIQDRTLVEVGGKGLFTQEIEDGLLGRHLDLAVHSMKDMPSQLPDGLMIGAILPREDVRDVLLSQHGHDLAGLPAGAVIGTASLRRQALIRAMRPDCRVVPLRGNVGTRLQRLASGDIDATILAAAGLNRLQRSDITSQACFLDPDIMVPAVAQGAIGIEIRHDDPSLHQVIQAIACPESTDEVAAERAFLAVLDGSCRTPIGGLARWQGSVHDNTHNNTQARMLSFHGVVASPDGGQVFRQQAIQAVNHHDLAQKLQLICNFGQNVAKNLRDQLPTDFMDNIQIAAQKAI